MKNLFVLLFILIGVQGFTQKTNPVNPRNNPKKDSVIYLAPEGEVLDSTWVFAIVADLNQPLSVQKYRMVTKFWVYKNQKKVPADQWLEKVTEGVANRVTNFKKRTLWMIREDEF